MMTNRDPELADDAPLRSRLWWACWRRWRVLLGGTGLLVVVAWWTRPDLVAHHSAAMRRAIAIREARSGLIVLPWRTPTPAEILVQEVGPWNPTATNSFRDYLLFTQLDVSRGGATAARTVSLGAFGIVWVLDE